MAVEYGLITKDMKEKDIVKEISKQLELFFIGKNNYDIYKKHNLTKHKNRGGISFNPEKIEWNYEYSYDYFNKPFGVFIELYPNTNSEGESKFKREGVTWNLYVNDISDNSKLVPFILEGLSCEVILIKEYVQNEERL